MRLAQCQSESLSDYDYLSDLYPTGQWERETWGDDYEFEVPAYDYYNGTANDLGYGYDADDYGYDAYDYGYADDYGYDVYDYGYDAYDFGYDAYDYDAYDYDYDYDAGIYDGGSHTDEQVVDWDYDWWENEYELEIPAHRYSDYTYLTERYPTGTWEYESGDYEYEFDVPAEDYLAGDATTYGYTDGYETRTPGKPTTTTSSTGTTTSDQRPLRVNAPVPADVLFSENPKKSAAPGCAGGPAAADRPGLGPSPGRSSPPPRSQLRKACSSHLSSPAFPISSGSGVPRSRTGSGSRR